MPDVTNAGDRILSKVLGMGDQLSQQKFQQNTEEAYLSGVAKAGTIKSEAELDSSPLMRSWQTAGYRDTMGRIAAADNESQIAIDMKSMREKSPEQFGEYLAQKRSTVMGAMQGMTLQTRQTMFAQQMLNERAAIKLHASEHYKFVVDTEAKSIKTGLETSIAALNASKSDASAYGAATDATFATAYSSIIANPKLPQEMKGKQIADLATYALESDNQALYQQIMNKKVPHVDGSSAPMSHLLSWEDNIALSKANLTSLKRTEAFRAQSYMDRSGLMEADWANPNSPLMPIEQVRAHIAEGIQGNYVNADQTKSIMEKWAMASTKKVVQADLASAYLAGDHNQFLKLGKTSQEGLDAYVNVVGRKSDLPTMVDNLLNIGKTTGQDNAFRKVGELMGPAFAQIGNNDKIDPANAVSIAGVLQKLDKAEKDGHDGAFNQFLGAFAPDVQAKVTYMRAELRKGSDPTAAIASATARVLEDAKMTPAMRTELAGTNAKEVIAAVNDLTPRGIWGTGMLYAKSFLSPTKQGRDAAGATIAATAYQGWFENDSRVNEVMAGARLAVSESMSKVLAANPHMAINDVRGMALADVSGRTVGTDWGPLVVPAGFTPQRFFGVGTDVGTERIGAALKEYIKPASPDNRIAFSLGVSGQLMYQELNKFGRPAAPAHILDPQAVKPMVEAQRQRQADDFAANHGEGVTKTVNGVSVTYNGDNTANVENSWMRRLRGDLVDHEGVKDTAYPDLSGKVVDGKPVHTVGVGVSSHNPAYPKPDAQGKVTPAQIGESFKLASNEAAQVAQRVMMKTGTISEGAFKLYGSLAYQSGPSFTKLPAYTTMLDAIGRKDEAGAMAALIASPAYKMSQPARQQYYTSQLKAAMKG